MKFLQPYVFKLVPQRWRGWLESILYPTCAVKTPPSKQSVESENAHQCRCKDEDKDKLSDDVAADGEVVSDKKND